MDIKLPKSQTSTASLATHKIDSLNLKLTQQLEVKVISSESDKQTLLLQTLQSNKSIQVESNLPIETKPGQSLQLSVTKLAPGLEFKIIKSDAELNKPDSQGLQNANKQLDVKDLILKQIIPKIETLNTLTNSKSSSDVMPATVLTAKVIAINNDNIQLKLYITPSAETGAYTKNLKQNILHQLNPIITLNKQKLISSETKPSQTEAKQMAGTELLNFKPGQKIQLELSKEGINPEFKLINNANLNLVKGQLLHAKVIKLNNEIIQLALFNNQKNTTDKLIPTKPGPSNNQPQIITVTAKQLGYPVEKSSQNKMATSSVVTLQNLKPGQNFLLEVKKTGTQPEFKIIEPSHPKLNTGQIVTAKVIDTNNNKIQLQLPSSTLQSNKQTINHAPTITLNKSQLTDSTKGNIKTAPIGIPQLKPNQEIKLEVVKTGIQPEFKILDNKPVSEQIISELKVLETVKQVLPIQQPVSGLVDQIIKTLPLINNNENVPDALKRIAREILDSIPQVKNVNDAKQLKKSMNNSGLFLETKLAYSVEKKSTPIQADFKAQLLKLHYAFKQALNVKKEQKLQSADLNLIKEMQQKTESSLAKIILNQLTSLPKDDGPRQVWVLDIPFLNKETADSVRIEIDQEKQANNDEKQENWTVNITVTPPDLDTIHCKISCFDKTINTRFWSDTQDVVTKITQHLDYLKLQLEKAGINPGHMTAHMGVPNAEKHHKITDQSLFDQEV